MKNFILRDISNYFVSLYILISIPSIKKEKLNLLFLTHWLILSKLNERMIDESTKIYENGGEEGWDYYVGKIGFFF